MIMKMEQEGETHFEKEPGNEEMGEEFCMVEGEGEEEDMEGELEMGEEEKPMV